MAKDLNDETTQLLVAMEEASDENVVEAMAQWLASTEYNIDLIAERVEALQDEAMKDADSAP